MINLPQQQEASEVGTRAALVLPQALCALLIALAYFATLGLAPLIEPDEPRYAEIAREMVERNDWVTPHLNYVKYFEKPPLVYWLTATNISLFGQHEFWVRLWPAVFACLGIAVAWWLGRRIYGAESGFLAMLVLGSAPLYFGLGQVLTLDMPLTGLLTLCLAFAWRTWERGESARWAPVGFALATALAVLTKGPVAVVLAGGSLATFTVLVRRWLWWKPLLRPSVLALFVLISAPWFVLVSVRNPEFVHFFFVEQHLGRYLAPTEHREPVWFFVPVLLAGFLPWAAVLGARLYRSPFTYRRVRGTERAQDGTLFLASWVLFPFAFFSLSGSKLGTYILPVFPPLAVLLARWLQRVLREEDTKPLRLCSLFLLFLGIGTLVASRLAPLVSGHYRAALLPPYLMAAGLVLLLGSFAAWRFAEPGRTWGWLFATFGTALGLLLVTFCGRSVAEHYKPLALAIRDQWQPGDRIVLLGHYTQGIPYYTGQRAILVRSWGELDFGSRQGDQSAFFWPQEEQILAAWRQPRRLFLVLNRHELARLEPSLEPKPRIIAQWRKKIVVVNSR